MITFGRRGGRVLLALTIGALLAVGVAVAATNTAPTDVEPVADARQALVALPAPQVTAPVTPAAAPTPTPEPPPTPVQKAAAPTTKPNAAQQATGPESAVVSLTNAARGEVGCAPLRIDPRLSRAAQAHSTDMAENGYFAHDSQDGRSFADRIRAAGNPEPAGENIAMGQRTAAEVVAAWLNSPGHRRNIEDCTFTTIGVGFAGSADPGGAYWTQDFAR